jgi:hypothetical protein
MQNVTVRVSLVSAVIGATPVPALGEEIDSRGTRVCGGIHGVIPSVPGVKHATVGLVTHINTALISSDQAVTVVAPRLGWMSRHGYPVVVFSLNPVERVQSREGPTATKDVFSPNFRLIIIPLVMNAATIGDALETCHLG